MKENESVKRENVYLLEEECERLQGLEKEAKGSTHIRQVRKVKVKKSRRNQNTKKKKELEQNGGR
jgi:hypothetical protein